MAKVTIFINNGCYMMNAGITQIIFEQTQLFFTEQELESEKLEDLFYYLNDWLVVGTINLDDLSMNELTIFNQHCKQAKENYSSTNDAKNKEKVTLGYILRIWTEFLSFIYEKLKNNEAELG